MIMQVILPQLGDTMDTGTITSWYKREGERVTKGEPLFQVLTDKANIDVEATTSGFLRQVLFPENATVPTGQVIAYLTTSADEKVNEEIEASAGIYRTESPGGTESNEKTRENGQTVEVVQSTVIAAEASRWPRRKPFVSPRARRLAQESGVNVSQLTAVSKTGRIMEADVRRFLAERAPTLSPRVPLVAPFSSIPSAPPLATADTISPITGVRKTIFDRMSASSRDVAHVTLTTDADATRLVELRAELNARQSDMKFSFTDLLVLLVARTLVKFPYMNATLREDGVHHHAFVNLGVAADTERGLLVPVIRDAQHKGLGEIYTELRRLGEAARTGKISPEDLRGGAFTITNLGQYEIDAFTPIVNQPETGILGIGRIAQKPAAYQGQLALRWMVTLSLSFDHRLVDGAPAARFLQQVKALVETPELVLI